MEGNVSIEQNYSAEEIIKFFNTKNSGFWLREGEKRALNIFHSAAVRVPAYKDFLKKNKINPEKIKTWEDFQSVPPINKKTYLRQYPLEKLSWDGNLKKPLVFTSTSGSTGEPFYFPRSKELDWESSIIHDVFIRNSSRGLEGPTLVIVAFGMGVWIGGLLTYKAFEIAAQRNRYPISILTTGINKIEIFKALKKLSPSYKQTILTGYPPFLKDVIDEAASQGIDLKKINLRLLSAAEAFTENFRDYLVEKAGIKNLYLDTLNIYGSADIGTMAYETPVSILIRRLAAKRNNLFQDIFTKIRKTPTLAQYNPLFIKFEAPNGEILLTGNNTVPLIRYAIGDHGGVFDFDEAVVKLKNHGFDLKKEVKKASISRYVYDLPFVYVYERVDFSTTLYGLQIYPEMVREALIRNPISKNLTGKFTMLTKYDKNQDQHLEINLEVKKGKKLNRGTEKNILTKIFSTLCIKSSEYRELSKHIGERSLPKLVFWPAEHPQYFKPGVKQKWVEK